ELKDSAVALSNLQTAPEKPGTFAISTQSNAVGKSANALSSRLPAQSSTSGAAGKEGAAENPKAVAEDTGEELPHDLPNIALHHPPTGDSVNAKDPALGPVPAPVAARTAKQPAVDVPRAPQSNDQNNQPPKPGPAQADTPTSSVLSADASLLVATAAPHDSAM